MKKRNGSKNRKVNSKKKKIKIKNQTFYRFSSPADNAEKSKKTVRISGQKLILNNIQKV